MNLVSSRIRHENLEQQKSESMQQQDSDNNFTETDQKVAIDTL